MKKVIEAEEGLHEHHQRWYSSIAGEEARPGPFTTTAVGRDRSHNGMAYYLQQRGLYLDMSNHTRTNWVPPSMRKSNNNKRLRRKPDDTWACRRYDPGEPELPSIKKAIRVSWQHV